ncbi:MAG: hypothetical protein GWN84_18430 [Gammaproteobacteria bacterium]|nr:hypothetical protein [Gammaproteobacteria bacterium]NIR84810.1 hypothetical protein [Gammaproteobacteria bacterium]NIR91524.1 hypothetical protein [Gammaproteobacteria bacterium]NIV76712.1 hypothetical protein [Gammaproteobacteria bacterium]
MSVHAGADELPRAGFLLLAGLAVLMGPDIAAVGAAPLGVVFMRGAAVSWAAAPFS